MSGRMLLLVGQVGEPGHVSRMVDTKPLLLLLLVGLAPVTAVETMPHLVLLLLVRLALVTASETELRLLLLVTVPA